MSVWGKLFTAVRGGANEAGEAIVDSQAMRILDQELRDTDNSLRKARGDLANMMATAKRIEKRGPTNLKTTSSFSYHYVFTIVERTIMFAESGAADEDYRDAGEE